MEQYTMVKCYSSVNSKSIVTRKLLSAGITQEAEAYNVTEKVGVNYQEPIHIKYLWSKVK